MATVPREVSTSGHALLPREKRVSAATGELPPRGTKKATFLNKTLKNVANSALRAAIPLCRPAKSPFFEKKEKKVRRPELNRAKKASAALKPDQNLEPKWLRCTGRHLLRDILMRGNRKKIS